VLVVAAVSGRALLRHGDPLGADAQQHNVAAAASALAGIARQHSLVVTHGNGPQIGLLALQSEAVRDVRAYPLDVLGAESEGMIGYLLEQQLANALPERRVASLLTEVVVDALDPAFRYPAKPIGRSFTEPEARRLAEERGWNVAPDEGGSWRRVVASPMPRSVAELGVIRLLLEHGVVVVCAGGGGIPVVVDVHGARHGVEAVIDKDRSAAMLARQLGADLLLLLTDVVAVQADWDSARARPLRRVTPDELRGYSFAAGSMAPKVEAASWFVATTGRRAAIGALADASSLVKGDVGTIVMPSADRIAIGSSS
jgi:carbamate kinase